MGIKEDDHFSEGRKALDMVVLAAAVGLGLEMMKQEAQNPLFQMEAVRRGLTPQDVQEQINRVAAQLLYIRLIAVEESTVRGNRVVDGDPPTEEPDLPELSDEELEKQVERAIYLATDDENYNESVRRDVRGGE